MARTATKWSEEKIIAAIQERHACGKEITMGVIKRDDTPLRGAIEKYYGGIRNALIAAGFVPEDIQKLTYWNKEKIKLKFLSVITEVSSISELSRKHKSLEHAVRKHYGTYENLCADIGIDVSVVKRQVREWRKEDLLKVLIEMRDEGLLLNITNVKSRFPSVHEVAVRCFGSYENALNEIGESLGDHICEMKYDSYIGKSFERILSEMFLALGYTYLYQKRLLNGTIMPDFIDERTNFFIDAKLSSWTVFHSDTLNKYTPHCDRLIVVYLRGSDIAHDVDKLELRHVSFYYDELRINGLERFIQLFSNLEARLTAMSEEAA